MITHDGAIALPESQWRHETGWVVVSVGDTVTACHPGERILFHKQHRPKEVWLGGRKFYIGRETAVVAILA